MPTQSDPKLSHFITSNLQPTRNNANLNQATRPADLMQTVEDCETFFSDDNLSPIKANEKRNQNANFTEKSKAEPLVEKNTYISPIKEEESPKNKDDRVVEEVKKPDMPNEGETADDLKKKYLDLRE